MKKGAPALINSLTLDQLCDAVISKLTEHVGELLPSKRRLVASNASKSATTNTYSLPNSNTKIEAAIVEAIAASGSSKPVSRIL